MNFLRQPSFCGQTATINPGYRQSPAGSASFVRYGAAEMTLAEDLALRAAVAMQNAELYWALQTADHAKNAFLATLSSELRNPLAAIVSGLGLVTLILTTRSASGSTPS